MGLRFLLSHVWDEVVAAVRAVRDKDNASPYWIAWGIRHTLESEREAGNEFTVVESWSERLILGPPTAHPAIPVMTYEQAQYDPGAPLRINIVCVDPSRVVEHETKDKAELGRAYGVGLDDLTFRFPDYYLNEYPGTEFPYGVAIVWDGETVSEPRFRTEGEASDFVKGATCRARGIAI